LRVAKYPSFATFVDMPKPPPDKVQEEVDEQEAINYGTGYTEGDHEVFDNTKEMVKDVAGNEPEEGKPFSIAEEIDKDTEDEKDQPHSDDPVEDKDSEE